MVVVLERNYIGVNKDFEVYLFYQPDLEYLKATALNLQLAERLGKDKKKLVFAPMKYLDQDHLNDYKIDYCQLPFEIYKFIALAILVRTFLWGGFSAPQKRPCPKPYGYSYRD